MKIYLSLMLCCVLLFASDVVLAQDDAFSEDDIFSDVESVVDVEETTDDSILDVLTEESTTFSGEITANFGYAFTRDYFDNKADLEDNPYSTSMEGDFLLDVRLTKGIKAFADLWVSYTPQNSEPPNGDETNPFYPENGSETMKTSDDDHLQTSLKEFFVDANIKRKVYFRFGKQNLKWGRGYLWNPTDLISEDRKDFNDIDARREGVYGLKMHIPFGTTWNIYSFVNASGANNVDEFSVAGKVEVLLPQNIEMSVSAWKKKDYKAVYGVDFATHKFNTDWRGELSLSKGDNRSRLEEQNGQYVDVENDNDWTPRVALGFTRMFDHRDVNNRLSVTGEFYYNHAGYEDDMLGNEAIRDRFLEDGYFEPNNYGKYYAALFTSYSKFIVSDMTLNVNAISNLSDSSFMVSSGVTYGVINNLWLSCDVKGYLGSKNKEYTLMGDAVGIDISASLAF